MEKREDLKCMHKSKDRGCVGTHCSLTGKRYWQLEKEYRDRI